MARLLNFENSDKQNLSNMAAASDTTWKITSLPGASRTEYECVQGRPLGEFIELHCPEDSVRCAHFGTENTTKPTRKYEKIPPSDGTIADRQQRCPYASYSKDVFRLSEYGKKCHGQGQGLVIVYQKTLRCLGSFCRNQDGKSGSNCQKDPHREGCKLLFI